MRLIENTELAFVAGGPVNDPAGCIGAINTGANWGVTIGALVGALGGVPGAIIGAGVGSLIGGAIGAESNSCKPK